MAIRLKPKTADEFVSQAAAVSVTEPKAVEIKDPEVKFVVRIPRELVEAIDSDRTSHPPKQSRNSWIIQAVVNQLKKVN
jgi:predicted HicB family RNase H-like nuclease